MDLKQFAGELQAKNQFIKASFGGFAGSGKSTSASMFIIGAYKALKCTKPILFIDNEKGSRFLVPLFKNAGIETLVKDTIELADILEAFKYLQNGEIDFLFIDSLTKVWYKYQRDYRAKNRKTFMTLQDWGKILPEWQEKFADAFVNLNGNCVFTGRGGNTYDMEEDENGKKSFVKSGVKMKMAGETPFEPDLNIWMSFVQNVDKKGKVIVHREALIQKDRSGLIDGKTFINPTYKDFAPVIDYLISVPKGEVKGASSTENLAPHEAYNERKAERTKLLEEIKGCFDSLGLGSSADAKKIKADMLNRCFGTTSGSAIEVMQIAPLQLSHALIVRITDNMVDYMTDNGSMTVDEAKDIIENALKVK